MYLSGKVYNHCLLRAITLLFISFHIVAHRYTISIGSDNCWVLISISAAKYLL